MNFSDKGQFLKFNSIIMVAFRSRHSGHYAFSLKIEGAPARVFRGSRDVTVQLSRSLPLILFVPSELSADSQIIKMTRCSQVSYHAPSLAH